VIELHIPESTPSLNRIWGGHWKNKHELRTRWLWLVRQARLKAKVYDRPNYPRARLTIERWGAKHLDHDNFVAGTKPMVDSLVQEGLIAGDSPDHIGIPQYIQHIGKQRGTLVRIEGETA
jgi:hypothetical protein